MGMFFIATFGHGQPTFMEHVIFTTMAYGGFDVHAVDVDGDGDMDVVSTGGNELSWQENDGSESFTTHLVSLQHYGLRMLTQQIWTEMEMWMVTVTWMCSQDRINMTL